MFYFKLAFILFMGNLIGKTSADCTMDQISIVARTGEMLWHMRMYPDFTMPCEGWITHWAYHAYREGQIYPSAYTNLGGKQYKIAGYNKVTVASAGIHVYRVPLESQFYVNTSLVLGVFHDAPGTAGLQPVLSTEQRSTAAAGFSAVNTQGLYVNDIISGSVITLSVPTSDLFRVASLRPYIEVTRSSISSVITRHGDCTSTNKDTITMQVPTIVDSDFSTCANMPSGTHAVHVNLNVEVRTTVFVVLAVKDVPCIPPGGVMVFLGNCSEDDVCGSTTSCFLQSDNSPHCNFYCNWHNSVSANRIIIQSNTDQTFQICEVTI